MYYKPRCKHAAPGTAPAATDRFRVYYTLLNLRPNYRPGEEDEPDDMFDVIRMGPLFRYLIPTFDVLLVGMHQIQITGDCHGVTKVYDLFIHDHSVLNDVLLPAVITAKDYVLIPVSLVCICTVIHGSVYKKKGKFVFHAGKRIQDPCKYIWFALTSSRSTGGVGVGVGSGRTWWS